MKRFYVDCSELSEEEMVKLFDLSITICGVHVLDVPNCHGDATYENYYAHTQWKYFGLAIDVDTHGECTIYTFFSDNVESFVDVYENTYDGNYVLVGDQKADFLSLERAYDRLGFHQHESKLALIDKRNKLVDELKLIDVQLAAFE